jgi:hypothetical protein
MIFFFWMPIAMDKNQVRSLWPLLERLMGMNEIYVIRNKGFNSFTIPIFWHFKTCEGTRKT